MPPNSPLSAVVAHAAKPDRMNPFIANDRPSGWELTELRLPKSTGDRRPCARKFVVRTVPRRTVELADALLLQVNSDARAMASLFDVFAEFRVKNPLITEIDAALMLFIIDIIVQGIKASSAQTYLRSLVAAFQRKGTPIQSPLVSDTAAICQLIMAGEETEHAIDIDLEDAWTILENVSVEWRPVAFLMLSAGIRCADLNWILVGDLRFTGDKKMHVYFRRTKNHRTTRQRFSIAVEVRMVFPELIALVNRKEGFPLFERRVEASDFNRELQRAARVAGHERARELTSYSLRRCFIQTAIAEKTTGDIVAWMEVVQLTGHLNLETLRTSYAPKFANNM